MIKVTTKNPNETENVGLALSKTVKKGDVIALYGDLGAGKTAFVRGLARGLGYTGEVTSPTYTLMHEYKGKIPLYHFDMYRITDEDSLYSTGYFDYLETDCLMAIEWSENIEFALPYEHYKVTLKYGSDENTREIIIDKIIKDIKL